MISQSDRDRERRITVERHHQLRDVEEDFEVAKGAATPEERRALDADMVAFRRRHREEDVERGKRSPGFGILMHQIMWARWCEVMVSHELAARNAFAQIRDGDTSALLDELQQSLVAITAAAVIVEALYEDTRFLVSNQRVPRFAHQRIASSLAVVFGSDAGTTGLEQDLEWLFNRRNVGVHAYSEPEAPQMHPAGVGTSAEASRFNAVESARAADIALRVLAVAASPPNPANRWVERWVRERSSYHETVIAPLRQRRD